MRGRKQIVHAALTCGGMRNIIRPIARGAFLELWDGSPDEKDCPLFVLAKITPAEQVCRNEQGLHYFTQFYEIYTVE